MPGYFIWGASPILGEDNRYHLFCSRWPKSVTFFHWATHSEVVRASADRPEGPYTFEEVVLGEREAHYWDATTAHNPTIHFCRGTYLLFYTGANSGGPRLREETVLFSRRWVKAWNSKRIGLATSKSVFGPWKRCDEPILLPRPGKWDSVITSNPAPCVHEDGRVTLIYKSTHIPHPEGPFPGRFHLGVAQADYWNQPFHRLSEEPITIHGHPDHHVEDGYLWWNGREYEMLTKDMVGEICGEAQAGVHATSQDAVHWRLSDPPKAYSRTVRWSDGTTSTLAKLERPQLLKSEGRPTHLFAATLQMGENRQVDDSWNCVFPLE